MTTTRKEVDASYKKIMKSVRSEMGIVGNLFSYIIHLPILGGILTLLARTVLRPVPLLSAGIIGLAGGLGMYGIALYNGYAMNTSLVPLLLLAGLFIGIVFDYLRIFFGGSA